MTKEPPIGILFGLALGIIMPIIVWFSGLLAPETEWKVTDTLKRGGPYVNQLTTAVTESGTYRTLEKATNAIKESSSTILQSFNSQESLLPAIEIDKWRRHAVALGVRNPDIQAISLVPKQQFSSVTEIQGKRRVKIQGTIVSIAQERLVVEIVAWTDGEKTLAESSYVIEPLSPGKVFDLMKHSRIKGVSAIKLAILSRPANDRLIIALDGLGAPNKAS
jgi:hypothetical protein